MKTNENEKKAVKTLWDAEKAALRGKQVTIQAHLQIQEKSQLENLTAYIKEIEAKQQRNLKPSRRLIISEKNETI